ncbi:MAG: hypothetical protein M3R51_06225 [Candidatus Eremiobacteraeota bacterium]|nr:hypothetical protein [Candidatus Eremiobacteraeota bacterium]
MEEERTRPYDSQEEIAHDDDRSEAIIGADDTGMISDQRLVVESEIAEELDTDNAAEADTDL